ncbi:unnamed protein product [Candida parapsilosis]
MVSQEEEKVLVVERIRGNQQGFGNPRFKKEQFIEALTDHRTWLFFIFAIAIVSQWRYTTFRTILLNEQFGFDTAEALLMQMPSGGVEIVGCILFAWLSQFIKSRYCVGNLVGPQIFLDSQAPVYSGGKIGIVVAGVAALVCLILVYISYYVDNKRRDALPPVDMSKIENYEFADLTDKQNPNFRYAL